MNPPNNEVIRKIRGMSIEKILNFSMISEECKDLVKSIQIKGTFMSVSIGTGITFSITTDLNKLNLCYYTQPENMYWEWGAYGRKKKLLTPRTVRVEVFDNDGHRVSGPTLTFSELALKDWLKHLQDIFNYDEIDSIEFFENSVNYDIDDIREVFGNKSKFEMLFVDTDAYRQLILKKFCPIEKLSIRMSSFQNSKIPPSFLIQNFEYLSIDDIFHEKVITLNKLLMTNSKGIKIDGIRVSQKDFNKFMKLWQQGSNPHMECLNISYPNNVEFDPIDEEDEENFGRVIIDEEYIANTIMRGIKHDVVPANQVRKFKSVESKNPCLVHGGMDIHRNDGVKATIKTERMEFFTVWHMYVWFDHCVVE